MVVMVAGAAEVFVKANPAGVETPATLAFTAYDPAVVLAVNVEAIATPLAFVVVENVVEPLANVPLAPVEGAVKVTFTFGIGLDAASLTVA